MKIESVEAVPVAASFRTTFRFGTVDRSTSPNVVVIVRADDGAVGYGRRARCRRSPARPNGR
jgi:L-alanine-DL-glutamate epimerase-like enolase superfamily enzyme